jgi:hypothetical protein
MKPLLALLLTAVVATAADIPLAVNRKPASRIIVADKATDVERFAAEELQRYIGLMTAGVAVPIISTDQAGEAASGDILLGRAATHSRVAEVCQQQHIEVDEAALGSDGYIIRTTTDVGGREVIVLTSTTERGVLFAAYQFLEKLGVRFFGYRDRDGEVVPHRDTLSVPPIDVTERPSFRYRFVSDNGFGAAEKAKFVNIADWAAKNRCNIFMLTPSRSGETWEQFALDEVRKRGLMIAGPGHILARFTPERSLFAQHPEYFPLLKGARVANYSEAWGGVPSFCWSNEEAVQIVVASAMRYLDANPFIDVFAIYPPDGPQRGSQCQCDKCAQRSMSDWYLALINRIASECAARHPQTKVMWISYNECSVPPLLEQPWEHGKNMVIFWCNELRDFAAPMESDANRRAPAFLKLKPRLIGTKTDGKKNPSDTDLAAWHRWQNWSAWLKRSGFEGDVVLLDYYNAHAGHSLRVPMLQHCQSGPWPDGLMQRDFQFYRAQGITGWQNCTDYYNDSPHPYWNRLSAQLLWNPNANVSELDTDFYKQWFGPAGEVMQRHDAALWHELSLDHSAAERHEALKQLGDPLNEAERILDQPSDPVLLKRLRASRDFRRKLTD